MSNNLNTRIVITGGSGFIGTNLTAFYLEKGLTVLNIDIKHPQDSWQKKNWKQVDLLNYELLLHSILEFNPTHIVHLAARTDLNERNNIKGYEVNFLGQENILNVLEKCPMIKRAIFCSSMLVCKSGYNPKNYNDYCPPNLYGQSKVIGEQIVRKKNTSRYEWLIVRPTSIWGPWFGTPYKDFFQRIKDRKYFKVSGPAATKTFGYIGNTIYQLDKLLFLDSDKINGKTFYLGDDKPLNINEWADVISHKLKIKTPTLPFLLLKCGGWTGDMLQAMHIKFPLTSFRVKNMTTNNIIDLLDDTRELIPSLPYTTDQGVELTLRWMEEQMLNKTKH